MTDKDDDEKSTAPTDNVTLTLQIDPDWLDFVLNDTKLFRDHFCGYWARAVLRDEDLGWLVWDDVEKSIPLNEGEEPNRLEAIRKWMAGEHPLPDGWYRLDLEAAKRAWLVGAQRWGVRWYRERGANEYDYVIQMALFGEHRYTP